MPALLAYLVALAPIGGDTPFPLRGDIVFVAADGTSQVPERGTIDLWLGGRGGELVRAPIEHGSFACDGAFAPGWVDVGPIQLGDQRAWAISTWNEHPSPTDRVHLVAHPVEAMTMRVVDAISGKDVPSFDLYPVLGRSLEVEDRLFAGLSSPWSVELFGGRDAFPWRGWIGLRDYWVVVPGHAACHVWLDPSNGGTRTIAVGPQATLDIRLPETAIGGTLRLEGQVGDRPFFVQRPATPHVVIDGLAAGSWDVQVLNGPRFERSIERKVDLMSGETKQVDLSSNTSAQAPHLEQRVEMHGTLRVDPAWGEWPTLTFLAPGEERSETIDPSAMYVDPRDPSSRHWVAEGRSGRWCFSIRPFCWSQTVEAARGSRIDLVVPAPHDFRFRIARPDGSAIHDVQPRLRLADGNSYEPAAHPGVERTWSLRAPSEHATVTFDLPDGHREEQLDPSDHLQTVVARPHYTILVAAFDGDVRVPAPELYDGFAPSAERVDGAAVEFEVSASARRSSDLRLLVDSPGRYRVRLAPPKEYEPVAPIEIDVGTASPPQVDFHLQAKPR